MATALTSAGGVVSLPWDAALRQLAGTWKQGEHVTLLGHTGSGKTSVARQILPLRSYVVTVATKPEDDNLESMVRVDGFHKTRRWPVDPRRDPRVVYWPKPGGLSDVALQRDAVLDVLESVWESGRWSVYFDEIQEVTDALNLKAEVVRLLRQGRAMGITIIGSTQRPRGIPLEFYSQARHLLFWTQNDDDDLARISDLGGRTNKRLIRDTVGSLVEHEVLYVNTRDGSMWRSLPPPPTNRRR